MGAAPASDQTFNLDFQGQNIISGTLATLATNYGLGSGDSLLLAGCSAGARGAMVNVRSAPSPLSPPPLVARAVIAMASPRPSAGADLPPALTWRLRCHDVSPRSWTGWLSSRRQASPSRACSTGAPPPLPGRSALSRCGRSARAPARSLTPQPAHPPPHHRSGIWMDIPPPPTPPGQPTLVTLQQQTLNVYNLVNPGPLIPEACAQAYSGDLWK